MEKNVKSINLNLGPYLKTNLVFRKGSCSTQPVIDICNIGSKNGIQLSLGIVDNSPSSILNFGSYLKSRTNHIY